MGEVQKPTLDAFSVAMNFPRKKGVRWKKKTHLRRRRTGFLLINDYNNLYDRHIKSVRGNPFVNERFSTIEKEENRNTHIFIFLLSDLKYEREESNLTLYIQLSN